MSGHYEEEDIDSILSSIVQGQKKDALMPEPSQSLSTHQPNPAPSHSAEVRPSHVVQPQDSSVKRPAEVSPPQKNKGVDSDFSRLGMFKRHRANQQIDSAVGYSNQKQSPTDLQMQKPYDSHPKTESVKPSSPATYDQENPIKLEENDKADKKPAFWAKIPLVSKNKKTVTDTRDQLATPSQPEPKPTITPYIPYLSDDETKPKAERPKQDTQTKKTRKLMNNQLKRVSLVAVSVMVVGVVITGVVYRKSLIAIVLPQSPFTKELRDTIKYPLLYPTKLPLGYSIDATSVSKGSNGVIVYNLKNPSGGLIGISLQPEPSNLNKEAVMATLANTSTITVPAGTVVMGTSKDNINTFHTFTGTVWVITRVPEGVVPTSAIETMLSSLKEG